MTEGLRTYRLLMGAHHGPEDGTCVNEAASMIAGEEFSANPSCVDPIICRLAMAINDACGSTLRDELLSGMPYRIVGTNAGPAMAKRRLAMLKSLAASKCGKYEYMHIAAKDYEDQQKDRPAASWYAMACGIPMYMSGIETGPVAILLREMTDLLDRMIKLTEPQEAAMTAAPCKTHPPLVTSGS